METTRLSSKGQIIIPKALRDIYHWQTGQELTKSKHIEEFYTFDRQFSGKAQGLTQCAVKPPL